ncbi:hypothetical protein BCR33DRAFT_740656 [Rhizoclosmatium globosum]|uniref:G-protein coupled receptors family 3 profile domain-containing protein n=1 Tax=Rhizoclosmatium globosum TaxID=329046 RepID=A0A1Y2BZ01_9FUNG|nr:hypothetical protein BCR33DRAFT_740656 [Rhizoclosmatium globosum]|eukprot:ORY40002.1 hypothetical protein BCR33DRAFT_740656 [Rhizoclosmatium globosum]
MSLYIKKWNAINLIGLLGLSFSPTISSQQTVEPANIAFLFPYAINDPQISLDIRANDAAAELAVSDFNAQHPSVHFNILRKNIWDPAYATNWTLVDSGGYAIIETVNLTRTYEVVAAFGDYLSSTTFFTAEMLSYFGIPMCGATQTDPSLKDMVNIPYFMRMQNGQDYGESLALLLTAWNVTRLSVVIASDTLSTAYGTDILTYLKTYNITVQAQVYLTPQMQASGDYSFPLESLQQSQSRFHQIHNYPSSSNNPTQNRYFFICADSTLTADFYYAARDAGITGSGVFVWMGINRPYVGTIGQQTALYGNNAINDLQGFMWLKNDLKGMLDPSVVAFTERYPLTSQGGLPSYVRQSYDCAQILMTGLVQTTVVSFTTLFCCIQRVEAEVFGPFAKIGITASSYTLLSTPIFPGGSSTPPNDGSLPIIPVEILISPDSPLATLIRVMSYIGHATFAFFTVFFGIQKIRGAASHHFLFGGLVLCGAEMVFLSMRYWGGRVTTEGCVVQRFLLPIGYALAFGCVLAKLHHASTCLENKFERVRGVSSVAVLGWVAGFVVPNIAIAAAYVNYATVVSVTPSIISFYYVCSSTKDDPNYADNLTYGLYAVDGLLALTCAFYSQQLRKERDLKLLDILCKFGVLAGATMIAIPFLSNDVLLPQILRN